MSEDKETEAERAERFHRDMAQKAPWLLIDQAGVDEMTTTADEHARAVILGSEEPAEDFIAHLAVECRVPPGSVPEGEDDPAGMHLFLLADDLKDEERLAKLIDRIARHLIECRVYPAAATLTTTCFRTSLEEGSTREERLLTQALGLDCATARNVSRAVLRGEANRIVGLGDVEEVTEPMRSGLILCLFSRWFHHLGTTVGAWEADAPVEDPEPDEKIKEACSKLHAAICGGDPVRLPDWFFGVGLAVHRDPAKMDFLVVYLKDPVRGMRALRVFCPSMMFGGYKVETRIFGEVAPVGGNPEQALASNPPGRMIH